MENVSEYKNPQTSTRQLNETSVGFKAYKNVGDTKTTSSKDRTVPILCKNKIKNIELRIDP